MNGINNTEIMIKTIRIKLLSEYYDAVERRIKNFEVQYNDRDYRVGDWLVLCEWDGHEYTGYEIVRRITYICNLDGIGLKGWVAMGIE